MTTNDIIDNRRSLLIDHIKSIFPQAERVKFAIGYLFLSGLKPFREELGQLKEIKILIGSVLDKETLETLTQAYKRIELAEEAQEKLQFPKRTEEKEKIIATQKDLREAISTLDQTDEDEELVKTIYRLVEEKRLKVRIYTKGKLHSKAYIFDYKAGHYEKGIGIIGSSNFTLSGLTHNTELNVVVSGNANHSALVEWFEELWNEARDFEEVLVSELRESWVLKQVTPYDIYMKTLFELVRDRIEADEKEVLIFDDRIFKELADFQKKALKTAVSMIRDYGGCFIADVVGLGKSYVGSAVLKYFEQTERARPLIICPASLVDMWEEYNESFNLNARVVSMALLKEDESGRNFLFDKYPDRNLILLDESHNFRHPDTQRYRILQEYIQTPTKNGEMRRCVFLTATPRNKSLWDLYYQLRLFPEDIKNLPVYPTDLKEYFKQIERREKKLEELLTHLLFRRRRRDILRWYGYDAQTHRPLREIDDDKFKADYLSGNKRAYVLVGGRHQYFPTRELETITYSIEKSYQGFYQKIRDILGKPWSEEIDIKNMPKDELTYARYGLWHYVKPELQNKKPYRELQRAGKNLRGIIRVLLFKRLESSVYAFKESLKRLIDLHNMFLDSLKEGFVPAGDEAQALLYGSDYEDFTQILDELRNVSGQYDIKDFELELLKDHLHQDKALLEEMLKMVEPIQAENDDKLKTLKTLLGDTKIRDKKVLIFSQFADTVEYLYNNINPNGTNEEIAVIHGQSDISRLKIVARFAPKANPELQRRRIGEKDIKILISTDVLAEGLNLQDGNIVINYDLHWNPVRLIQRIGRVDRIGTEHDKIYVYNFLPETELEKHLGIKEKLERRIQEIHDTIGEDAKILDPSERLNEKVMYAIYEGKKDQLELFEEEIHDEIVDLNEAEEFFRNLQKEAPEEYMRIVELRDGIRTGRASNQKGYFVFCKAGKYKQLFLVDEKGETITRDISKILNIIKARPDEKAKPVSSQYNQVATLVLNKFKEEVKHRYVEREYTIKMTQAQRYIIRELRIMFERAKDDEVRKQINILEKAFRGQLNERIKKEINKIKRKALTGDKLFESLREIYQKFHLSDQIKAKEPYFDDKVKKVEIPKIVCGESLR